MIDLKASLRKELAAEKPRMIGIKGKWGVGKTYFWRRFRIKSRTEIAKLREMGYSYVSLFGINSMVEFRREVLGRLCLTGTMTPPGDRSPFRALDKLLRGTKFKGTGAFSLVADWVEDRVLKNCLICIDDMERIGPDLPISSILGYLNFLKEEKDCFIILIFNEEKLRKHQKQDLSNYREKVLDREFLYEPNIVENLRIVWGDRDFQVIQEVFVKAGNNNLRLMFKVREIIENFEPHLKGDFPDLWRVFPENCAKVVIIYYTNKNQRIKDYLIGTSEFLIWANENTIPGKLKKLFRRIEYSSFDSNGAILEYITEGWVDLNGHQKTFSSDDRRQKDLDLRENFSRVLDLYLQNFQASREEFVGSLWEFLQSNCSKMRLVDISGGVELLRELGERDDFQEIFECAASSFVSTGGDRNSIMATLHLDGALKETVEKELQKASKQKPLEDVFVCLSRSGGFDPEDFYLLEEYSEQEIAGWLLSSDRDDLIPRLRNLVYHAEVASKEHLTAKNLVEGVLGVIKRECSFRKYQIETLVEA